MFTRIDLRDMEAISHPSKPLALDAWRYEGTIEHEARIEAHPVQARLKRCFDVIGALVLLLLFVPVGLVIAGLVRFSSSGPLFFGQTRLGRQPATFRVLKFRSMFKDADVLLQEILEADPAMREEYARFHKLRFDPRVTPVGRVLRKFSLDEFPQLINVIRGEMSLVGPRPYLPSEQSKMYNHHVILGMRPGLTGPWQVGGRNALTFKERLALDEDYVRNWSFWLDVRILVRTVPVLLKGQGAS